MKVSKEMGEMHSKHMKMWGLKMIILGLLVLANAYWLILDWSLFIGVILIIAGLAKLLMPSCCK